jgi:DNA repair exonuclease SbcCD ATPase subunit
LTLNNLQIKIKDFKSIKGTDWISLDGKIEVIGRNFIDGGSNGSGKSSILEALYTSVSLCDVNDKSDKQKQLKKYFRDNKHPFEILVKFCVGNKDYQIKATPDGIKEGTAEGRKHLFMLITSFLMQGMTNSLIKQEASEVKTIISSYFECDDIIDNIINNSDIVKEQLNKKLDGLNEDQNDCDFNLSQIEVNLENRHRDLERLESEKKEIEKKVGFATFVPYDKNKHTKILSEIDFLKSSITTMDSEIMKLYEEKASLSNGVENRIKELKQERNKRIETAEGLYIRTIGNTFGSYVKKVTKEYNDLQKREYNIKNELAQKEKENKIAEMRL